MGTLSILDTSKNKCYYGDSFVKDVLVDTPSGYELTVCWRYSSENVGVLVFHRQYLL